MRDREMIKESKQNEELLKEIAKLRSKHDEEFFNLTYTSIKNRLLEAISKEEGVREKVIMFEGELIVFGLRILGLGLSLSALGQDALYREKILVKINSFLKDKLHEANIIEQDLIAIEKLKN
jgi:hypothetical protein